MSCQANSHWTSKLDNIEPKSSLIFTLYCAPAPALVRVGLLSPQRLRLRVVTTSLQGEILDRERYLDKSEEKRSFQLFQFFFLNDIFNYFQLWLLYISTVHCRPVTPNFTPELCKRVRAGLPLSNCVRGSGPRYYGISVHIACVVLIPR